MKLKKAVQRQTTTHTSSLIIVIIVLHGCWWNVENVDGRSVSVGGVSDAEELAITLGELDGSHRCVQLELCNLLTGHDIPEHAHVIGISRDHSCGVSCCVCVCV